MKNMGIRKWNGKFRAVACILAGCVILTGGVFANIDNANGYSAYKNAAKKLIKLNNAEISLTAEMYVDDRVLRITKNDIKIDGKNSSQTEAEKNISPDSAETEASELHTVSERYSDSEFDVSRFWYGEEMNESATSICAVKPRTAEDTVYKLFFGGDVDSELADKIISFAETAADGFIGGVKNNFVYLGEENGEKHYNVTLSREQMPGIVTSGLSLICGIIGQETRETAEGSTSRNFDYNDVSNVLDMMLMNEREPYIKSVVCDFKLDKNGNLTSNTLSGTLVGYTLDGKEHTAGIKIILDISDAGSASVDTFDVRGAVGDTVMLDGTTKSFAELIETACDIQIRNGNDHISFHNYNTKGGMARRTVFIVNGREVSNTEYNAIETETHSK